MLILHKTELENMCSHAEEAYPNECCGILLGKSSAGEKTVCKILKADNTAKDSLRFEISPSSLIGAELLAEKEKLEIIGVYHSHPDHDAAASSDDELHMIAGLSYPIISVKNGVRGKIVSFVKSNLTDSTATAENITIEGEK